MIQVCRDDAAYFLRRYTYIEDATEGIWRRFDLWPAQRDVLTRLRAHRQLIVLKARQLGLTWLVLGDTLAEMLFRPIHTALFFSRGDKEAKELLVRLKGMYSRLPAWIKDGTPVIDNSEEWRLGSGSRALSFPTTGGRSYTASRVVFDEADFIENFDAAINAAKPTIDAGGKMILISTVDKSKPESSFKRIYRGAKAGETEWRSIFLPWHARPGRDQAWYEAQRADVLARTTALDDLHQEYPATDTEALAPRSLDKRISPMWIEACYEEMRPLDMADSPALPGLEIYQPPVKDRLYVIGADPAEGNPTSDDSALTVLDWLTGEECAVLAGKFEPSTLGSYIKELSVYYNHAPAMIERNNHGHAVIQWVQEHAKRVKLLNGHDEKPGWMSSKLGKALLYTECADHFRQNARLDDPTQAVKILHSYASYHQLASIEGATLRAPEGQHDDRADSYAFAQVARAAGVQEQVSLMPQSAQLYGSREQERASRGNDRRGLYGSRT